MTTVLQVPTRAKRYPLRLSLKVWIRKFQRRISHAWRQPMLVEDTSTENISATGCYFLLNDEPGIRDTVEMEIRIRPGSDAGRASRAICRGEVVRIEKNRPDGRVGVACTIDHYRLEGSQHGLGQEQAPRASGDHDRAELIRG
jgi:hypothetical protein